MDEDELLHALAPVREHFSGREVNVNTVLAAYLRSYGLPASGQPWEAAKRAMSHGAGFKEAILSAALPQREGIEPAPVPVNQLPTPFEGRSLGWFPKQFSPGDIDGVGAKRLLGTPKINPAWVLVRETGQNSWDARGTSPSIDFILNLRLLRGPVLETLRRRVFTNDPPKTGLAELLRRDEIWALEISDRGTVGLGGPIRNDLAVDLRRGHQLHRLGLQHRGAAGCLPRRRDLRLRQDHLVCCKQHRHHPDLVALRGFQWPRTQAYRLGHR